MADFWLMADDVEERTIARLPPTTINWRSAGGDVRRQDDGPSVAERSSLINARHKAPGRWPLRSALV